MNHEQMQAPSRYPTAGIATNAQNAVNAPSRVQSAQMLLDSNVRSLHEAVNVLEERLQTVLGPPPPDAGKPSAQIKPVASTVADRINESTENLCYAINRISALTSRLEI